jgi:hypothetical protein
MKNDTADSIQGNDDDEDADKNLMKCQNNHIMKIYINSLPDYFSDDEEADCDVCNNKKIKEGGFFDCQECGYDVCKDCAESMGKYVKYSRCI